MKNNKINARQWKKNDPFYEREQNKYGALPLPSREYLLSWLADNKKPLTINEIINAFCLQERQEHFKNRINAMINSGQLLLNRQNKICLVKKIDLRVGKVIAHRDGYGFFKPDEGIKDGFITPKDMIDLMHDDRILARVAKIDLQGRENYIPVEILNRGQTKIVGRLHQQHNVWYVVPEKNNLTHNLIIPKKQLKNAIEKDIVVAEIVNYPTHTKLPTGKIISIIKDESIVNVATKIAIENHDLPSEFSAATKDYVRNLKDALPSDEYKTRKDYRALPFVTIDGATARDFDDAVYGEKRGQNYRLLVAIADVAHYVAENSAIDTDAYSRGSSVYFPNTVVPMLPKKLSNGLCSLNENCDRLVLVCEITISPQGEIKRSIFHKGIISSQARLTYEEAEEIIFNNDINLRSKFNIAIINSLSNLAAIFTILSAIRNERHAINFEFNEFEFNYDENGKIVDIVPRKRLQAHRLIEECMILANIVAAKFINKHKIAAPYRNHNAPSDERLMQLLKHFARFGISIKVDVNKEITPQKINESLQKIKNCNTRLFLQKMLLRSLSHAQYSPQNNGHFGLALNYYSHFTSPIRRYPDLLLHRAINYIIENGNADGFYYSPQKMEIMSKKCSEKERRAEEAERDVNEYLQCEFLSHRIGNQYQGTISNVVNFGLFITLNDLNIDGLLHISLLRNDYFHFDNSTLTLTGEFSGIVFAIGDQLTVKVINVNVDERKIDFSLIETHRKNKKNRHK